MVMVVVVVAFSSHKGMLGLGTTIHSPSALFEVFCLFVRRNQVARTNSNELRRLWPRVP